MTDLSSRIANLSPEKRALLTLQLKKKRAEAQKRPAIPRREDPSTYPLSFSQKRQWFLSQLEPDSPFYNISGAVRFSGRLDARALEKSLHEVVRRHEVLRSTFVTENGEPFQRITPALALDLPLIDLSALPREEREAQAFKLAKEEGQQPFDIVHGPLIRASLMKLEEMEHVLLLSMYHIVSDGWSMGVLTREISALYRSFCEDSPSPLAELPIQYADYAAWQASWLQGEVLEGRLAYWKQQLAGSPAVLELPTDRPRPAVQSFRGARQSFRLAPELLEKLKALGQREGASLFMTLLAAFQALLYRYSGQADINVGTPVANRDREEIEGLIGIFINTLVLHARISGEAGFRDLLKQVKETTLGAFENADLPFDLLVDALQVKRDTSYSPLFQVMFTLQESTGASLDLPGLKASLLPIDNGTVKFDLFLTLEENPNGLLGVLEYNTDLFEAGSITRMIGHFETLLNGIAADIERPIARLPLLPLDEAHRLLIEWNLTQAEFPQEKCFQQRFEEQVERSPDTYAVVYEHDQLTYRELNRRANILAHYLQSLGVQPDTLVGVCFERSVEMVVAILGILKAGGAYLPLDPTYPKDRLAFMLADARAPILITQEHLTPDLPEDGYTRIALDANWKKIAGWFEELSDDNPVSGATSANLAYVIYTSGSTGKPKGVMIEHRSMLNLHSGLLQLIYANHPGEHLRVSLNAPLPFDASVQELVMLMSGHTLYVIPHEVRGDGRALLAFIRRHKLDVVDCVPSQLKLLLAAGLLDGSGWAPRAMLPGGEAIDEVTWQRLAEAQGTEFYNMYGPTECTVDTVLCRVSRAPQRPVIGRPIINTQLYILDANHQATPIGVPGELYIAGASVGRGYLNRPDLTAERFLPDPFSDKPGARMYKTGDLVRYLEDGNVEFLGRVDRQVKVRGFRIELGEIETVLSQHPEVKEAAVLARDDLNAEDTPGSRALVAYILPRSENPPSTNDLRKFVKNRLPEYMLPSIYVFMTAFPLTPNGKLDRRALPLPDRSRRNLDDEYMAPRNELEHYLSRKWGEVLTLDRVGVNDNFFDLGGNSLQAAVLINRIQEELGETIPVRAVFQAPTVAELSQILREQYPLAAEKIDDLHPAKGEPGSDGKSPLPAGSPYKIPRLPSHEGWLPLSFAQQRLWFLDQLEPGTPLYNIASAIRLEGTLNVIALLDSLNELLRRHEILRTSFTSLDGQAHQKIAPALSLPLPVTDLQCLPEAQREAEALRLAQEEALRPFDLSQDPLIRARLIKLDNQDHVMLLTLHHIISDGWSTNVIVNEIAALYAAYIEGQPSPLPELPIQYADFAAWQRNHLQGEALASQLHYWEEQLKGSAPLLELPTDRPHPAAQTYHGAVHTFSLPDALSQSAMSLCQKENVTPFMLLLAAFETLLHRYSRQDSFNVGTPIANRNRADIENLIGLFVNTLVLPADFSGDPCFSEFLQRTRAAALGAYDHQELPFEMLVDALQPSRDLSSSPLFQVMFVYQEEPLQRLHLPGLSLSRLDVPGSVAKFDLSLFLTSQGDQISGAFEYNTDLFDAATIARLSQHFSILLQAILDDPSQSIATLPLLSDPERHQLLVEWNDTAAPFPDHLCAHQLFEQQALRTPHAPAVSFHGQTLSFDTLNRRANRLAHFLQAQNVSPDTLVGVCLPRSPDLVVALLATLKSGAAYLPLDPSYPPERLAFMLQDAQAPLLLTTSSLAATLAPASLPHTRFVPLDAAGPALEPFPEDDPLSSVTPANLAYVIYTSGSTGKPKGAMISHRGLVNYLTWTRLAYPLALGQGAPVHSSISFDLTVTAFWAPLMQGRPIWLLPEEEGVEALSSTLAAQGDFSLVKITPAHLQLLGQQLSPSLASSRTRAFIIGGENLTHDHLAFWLTHAPHTALVNEYGPTETVVGCCCYWAPHDCPHPGVIPIGRPILNTRLYVLDAHLQPVPVGVPGELFIGGVGVGRGYLNRPDLTRERFLPDPFSTDPAERLYRTGDLVRYLPDGNLECLGRIDFQVKIRGFRVELGEIEAALSRHPAIRENVVWVREDNGLRRLVAYLVPADPASPPSASELRDFLRRSLPDYMLPAAFVLLQALPLTANGKVDRKALPAPEAARPDLDAPFAPPSSPAEHTLAEIWRQVLALPQVGVHDNFFELGGDSILSIQIVARANQAGLRLSPRQLFEAPTIAGLAALASSAPVPLAEQGPVTGSLPLTPIQRWFFAQDFPNPHHFNQSLLFALKEPLQWEALEAALQALLAHHDALRLRFTPSEAGWQAQNAPVADEEALAWIDLADLPEAEQSREIEARSAQLQTGLDITHGPLLRAAYFRLGRGRADRLLLIVHHLAIDGVSWRILLEDLQSAYAQALGQQVLSLPPKSTSFRTWAGRLMEYATSEAVHRELDYWSGLQDASPSQLPLDFPQGENVESATEIVRVALTPEETQALLRDVPRAYHTEINDVLLTALAQCLCAWTGAASTLINLEGHGREELFPDLDLSRTLGWFTSLYPVRLDLGRGRQPGEALKAVKEQLRAVPRRGIGYGILRYLAGASQPAERLAALPQPQVTFNYLGQVDQALPPDTPFALAPEQVGRVHAPENRRSALIELISTVVNGQLNLEWNYSRALHKRSTIERLAQSYLEALRALIAHCLSPQAGGYTPSDFPDVSLSEESIQDLLEEMGQTL